MDVLLPLVTQFHEQRVNWFTQLLVENVSHYFKIFWEIRNKQPLMHLYIVDVVALTVIIEADALNVWVVVVEKLL